MSYEATRDTIATYIEDNWNQNDYPLFSENQGDPQVAGCFGRFSIRPVDAFSMYMGAQTAAGRRVNQDLWFQFFGLEGQGSADATKFADLVIALFDQKIMTNGSGHQIKFHRTELRYVGIEQSGRPMWSCIVPFTVDEL